MSTPAAHIFPKQQRLCGQMRIRRLYQDGNKLTVWPLRVTWLPAEQTQVLIWAPKSLFKHAVDRNRLRRQMREAWRLGDKPEHAILVAFNYMDREMRPFAAIDHAMKKAIRKLNESYHEADLT